MRKLAKSQAKAVRIVAEEFENIVCRCERNAPKAFRGHSGGCPVRAIFSKELRAVFGLLEEEGEIEA